MIVRFTPLAVVGAVLAPAVTHAHHSRAMYDMSQEIVIEGTVAELNWSNPHIVLTVDTKGADGVAVLREIEVMSVSEARALGLRQDAVPVGAHVVIRARPGRRGPTSQALGLDVRTVDGAVLPLNPDAGLALAPTSSIEARSIAGRWVPSLPGFTATFTAVPTWPFTESARAAFLSVVGESNALLGICEDYPPPWLSMFPDLREIEFRDSTVTLRFEAQGQDLTRVIHLGATAHPTGVAPTLLGHSIGRWEGETLVIDTIAFAPHPVGIVFGVPSGPGKHLVERLTLMSDRRHLQYELTLEDPAGLTAPITIASEWEYRPDLERSGVACDPAAARQILER